MYYTESRNQFKYLRKHLKSHPYITALRPVLCFLKSRDLQISRLFVWENVRKFEISGQSRVFFAVCGWQNLEIFFLEIVPLNLLYIQLAVFFIYFVLLRSVLTTRPPVSPETKFCTRVRSVLQGFLNPFLLFYPVFLSWGSDSLCKFYLGMTQRVSCVVPPVTSCL